MADLHALLLEALDLAADCEPGPDGLPPAHVRARLLRIAGQAGGQGGGAGRPGGPSASSNPAPRRAAEPRHEHGDDAAPSDAPEGRPAALPGEDGATAAALILHARDEGVRSLAALARGAVTRLLGRGAEDAQEALGLFTDEERGELADSLGRAVAAADLLGRARVREHQRRARGRAAGARSFAEQPAFHRFAEPVPLLTPQAAADYFLRLEPLLGIDPYRYGRDMERQAFTLAAATEEVLLDKVQEALGRMIATGAKATPRLGPKQVELLLDAAGVSERSPAYAENVYRTNLADAYNQGAWEEFTDPDVQEDFPAWRYSNPDDGRSRPSHAGRNGWYFPASVSFAEVRGTAIKDVAQCRCTFIPVYRDDWEDLRRKGARFARFSEGGRLRVRHVTGWDGDGVFYECGGRPGFALWHDFAEGPGDVAWVFADWQAYQGPRGGRGWKDGKSGRVVYGATAPDQRTGPPKVEGPPPGVGKPDTAGQGPAPVPAAPTALAPAPAPRAGAGAPVVDLAARKLDFYREKAAAHKLGSRLSAGWAKTLSAAERGAIEWYRGGGSRAINEQLRTGQPQPDALEEQEKDYGRAYTNDDSVRLLDAAVGRSSLPEPVATYRGLQSPEAAAALLARKPGELFRDDGFVSTSLSPQYAYWSFAQKAVYAGGPPVVARIEVPAGFNAAYVAHPDGTEAELLLQRGAEYEVGGTEEKTDDHGKKYHEVTLRVRAGKRAPAHVPDATFAEGGAATPGGGAELARLYADVWGLVERAGVTVPPEEIDQAGAELEGSGWAVVRGAAGGWSAERHPEGGVRLTPGPSPRTMAEGDDKQGETGGQHGSAWEPYTGKRGGKGWRNTHTGRIVYGAKAPGGGAPPRIAEGHARRSAERRASGDVDAAALEGRLAPHRGLPADPGAGAPDARRSFNALLRHHGELVVHRIDELSTLVGEALARAPADEEGLRRQLRQRLADFGSMLDWARARGITGRVAPAAPASAPGGDGDGRRQGGGGPGAADAGAGRPVAGEARGPGPAGADPGGAGGGEPARDGAPRRVPARVEEVNRRLNRYEQHFRSRGNHKAADWMGLLRGHVGSVGVEAALEALGPEAAGKGEQIQYGGHNLEGADAHFIEQYLNRAGITLIGGAAPEGGARAVSTVTPSSDEQGLHARGDARDVFPRLQGLRDKLHEAQHLPGLEKSEDLSKLLGGEFGAEVPAFTPAVVEKLDAAYGMGAWIVKSYSDDAYAGFGIFFPQRVQQLRQDAQNTVWAAGEHLARYGFRLARGKTGKVEGLIHESGDAYPFGTPEYARTIGGDARHWADRAAAAAEAEQGAPLPRGREGNPVRYMAQPAFPVVGVTNEERAAGVTFKRGQEGRVHVVTRGGKAEVIPHSTWLKEEPLPVVFEDEGTRAMAQAAVDAINALPESERNGQLYAPDIVRTADGYRVVEANPANEAGASGYLQDNPLIMDSYVSAVTGREPAHVQFIRRLLTTQKGTRPPAQLSPG
jgi:hypothetical protein